MLHALARRIGIMTQTGANARNLVRRHRGADPAAADNYPAFSFSADHSLAYRLGKIRIVHRSGAIRAFVNYVMPATAQVGGHNLLQLETGVIGADRDAHGLIFPPKPRLSRRRCSR